jgi:hypothetical protein
MKQWIRGKMGRRISLAVTAIVAAGALATSGSAAAKVSGTVTSMKGDISVGDDPAEIAGTVPEGESVVTGPEAACSVLVDRRSLVQFCGRAAIRLRYEESRSATIVDVMEGSTRALVGPRVASEPLEIHTPVAIAAILGTIVSVDVDPVTGDSTFALEKGKVAIRTQTSDPTRSRTIMLNAGEQVTVHKDGIADEARRLELQDVAGRASCMNDLHAIPIWIARSDREEEVTEKITGKDMADLDLPPVAAPPERPFGLEGPDIPLPDGGCGVGAVCIDDIPVREAEPPRPEPRTPSRPAPPDPCGGDNCGLPPSPPGRPVLRP